MQQLHDIALVLISQHVLAVQISQNLSHHGLLVALPPVGTQVHQREHGGVHALRDALAQQPPHELPHRSVRARGGLSHPIIIYEIVLN